VRTLEFAIATASIARNILMAACHLSYDLGHHPTIFWPIIRQLYGGQHDTTLQHTDDFREP
jgi:hypothetical protein